MSNREKYIKFLEANPGLPVFFKDWYLDLCAGAGAWDVLIHSEDDKIKVCWPYYLKRKMMFSYISMPHLCKFMGPIYAPGFFPDNALISELFRKLPQYSYFQQNIHYNFSEIVSGSFPVYCVNGQSFVLDLSEGEEKILAGLSADYRNNKIKKAKSNLEFSKELDTDSFFKLNQLSFSNQSKSYPVPEMIFKRIIEGMTTRACAQLFGVRDSQGRWHAGACVVWDESSVYYHSAGTDPELRSSGGGILLVWELIRWAIQHHPEKQFDFLGSNIPAIARVWKNFGARPKEYAMVEHSPSPVFRFLRKLKYRKA